MIKTDYYINNIKEIIRNTNQEAMRSHKFQNSFIEYNKYMKKRLLRLKEYNYDYNKLLDNNSFINDVIKMLRYFHMDQRGSVLMFFDNIHDTIIEVSYYFNKLNSEKIRLESLNLKENIDGETVNSLISNCHLALLFK